MLNGTNLLRWFEFTLSAIDGHGLDIDEMLVVSNTLFAYACGHAASEIGEREASVRSGMSRVEWMTGTPNPSAPSLKANASHTLIGS